MLWLGLGLVLVLTRGEVSSSNCLFFMAVVTAENRRQNAIDNAIATYEMKSIKGFRNSII